MPHFTTEDLRFSAQQFASLKGRALIESFAVTEMANEADSKRLPPVPDEPAVTPVVIYDIFLSHSSLDAIQILGLYKLLTARGYSVYIDRICDPQLDRSKVNRRTARVLRYRMAQCKSLFVATTQNAIKSSWVPWELGWEDGWNNKAAVLPILQQGQTSFNGQEYFELYPEIRFDPTCAKPRDLDVYEFGRRLYSWDGWLAAGRKF